MVRLGVAGAIKESCWGGKVQLGTLEQVTVAVRIRQLDPSGVAGSFRATWADRAVWLYEVEHMYIENQKEVYVFFLFSKF